MRNSIISHPLVLALSLGAGLASCSKTEMQSVAATPVPAAAPAASSVPTKDQGPWEAGDQVASGLPGVPNIEIVEVHANGEGDLCGTGKSATLKYTAMKSNGDVVDPGRQPFTFKVGTGGAIKGWDVMVSKMRVGDSLTVTMDKGLAYNGSRGIGDMKFDMELLSFK